MNASSPTRCIALVLCLCATFAAPAAAETAASRALDRAAPALVTVRYVLEQEGAEFGGITQRSHLQSRGFLVTSDGLVVVGGEIFPDEELLPDGSQRLVDFRVQDAEGEVHAATLEGYDPDTNTAYVRIGSPRRFPHLEFQQVRPEVGERLYAVGRLAEGFGAQALVRPVHVAARDGQGRWILDELLDLRFLTGPLFSEDGRVAGMVGIRPTPPGIDPQGNPEYFPAFVATVPQGKRFGLPVGIPGERLEPVIADPPPVPQPGATEKAWIGITLQHVPRELAEHWKLPTPSGVAVTSVIEDSPAEAAGLRVGDVIISFRGDPVRAEEEEDLDAFIRRVQLSGTGRPAELEVFRRGRVRDMEITLGEAPRPMRTAPSYISRDFGLKARDLTFDFAQRRNLPTDLRGVVVEELESGGWADVAGVREGDVILEVDRVPVPDVEAFRQALEEVREAKQREVVFFIRRGPNTAFLSVRTDY